MQEIAQLYVQHAHKLRLYIRSRVESMEVAEDIMHDTFVRVMQTRVFEYSEALLYKVARDRIVDEYRYDRRHPQEYISGDFPDKSVLEMDSFDYILDLLTDEQKEVVKLRYMDDLEFAAIAEKLNKTEGSVKQLSKRAVRTLREYGLNYFEGGM
jgi:RNA polymerase sigma-70 factor (ECF subfamily)